MSIGSVILFIDTVYAALELFGIAPKHSKLIGSVPLFTILMTSLCVALFVAAFIFMIVRR